MGLREKIKHSETETEIVSLLKLGETYQFASDYTKRAWKSTARFRLSELSNPDPVQTPIVANKQENKQNKNKKIRLRLKKKV